MGAKFTWSSNNALPLPEIINSETFSVVIFSPVTYEGNSFKLTCSVNVSNVNIIPEKKSTTINISSKLRRCLLILLITCLLFQIKC